MDTVRLRWGSKSSWGECSTAKSRITCDNTNGNTTLSEAQGVSLRITSVCAFGSNECMLEQGLAHKSVIVGVSHDLMGDSRNRVPRSLPWRESFGREGERGFDLTKSDLCPSFVEDLTAKGVNLRVADSHTGNHHEDGFTSLETIRRFL
ncbi:hypothetical protein Tco_1268244, partial [Tanacetum coccineum]